MLVVGHYAIDLSLRGSGSGSGYATRAEGGCKGCLLIATK